MRALDIDVPPELVERWVAWFAPAEQPFLVDEALAGKLGLPVQDASMSAELRDTYEIYGLPDGVGVVWLAESQLLSLAKPDRAALVRAQVRQERGVVPSVRSWSSVLDHRAAQQGDGHRFVWWPSLLAGLEEPVLRGYIEEGRRPSQHAAVPEQVWEAAADLLPDARRLAGTFAPASGPNCFGAVMAAAGVPGADGVWMLREPFEQWLSEATRPAGPDSGRDGEVGTVLVWRSPEGLVQHAAVTLGSGWSLHKPSQGWMSPTKVLSTDDVKRSARATGRRLERHTLLR